MPSSASDALVLQLAHRPQRLGERHVGVRPVDQQQVDALEPQVAQRGLRLPAHPAGVELLHPQLGRDEDLVAGHAGVGETAADLALVPVGPRRVEVAVAEHEGVANRLDAVVAAELPGPEADARHLGAADAERRGAQATSRSFCASASDCSFFSDWFSIWRMRSRVTLKVRPTSSSVRGCSPPRP
jgi:hypothetical protein